MGYKGYLLDGKNGLVSLPSEQDSAVGSTARMGGKVMRRGLLIAMLFVFLVGCAGAPPAKYPISKAQGRYTVVAQTFRDQKEKDGTVTKYAVTMANEWAEVLRKQGHKDVYVADLRNEAMVTMGTHPTRAAARSALGQVDKVLQGIVGTGVTVRGSSRSTGQRVPGMQRPYPEEIDYIKDLVKRRR